jgi:uncharacterized protein
VTIAEPPDAPQASNPDHGFRLGLGIERLGLLALSAPVVMMGLLLALAVLAGLGINRLQVDDSLSELFRNDTAEFRTFEKLSTQFPSSEYDVLVVAEAPDLLSRAKLAALRTLVTELNFVDGNAGVVSLFSAREAPTPGQVPPPLVPDDLPDGKAYDDLVSTIKTNEIIRGKLLSDDGQLALIVIALDREQAKTSLSSMIAEIGKTVEAQTAGSGLKVQLAGVPVMQLEIRNAVERDQLTYNGLGLIIGTLIALVVFRSVSLTVLSVVPPIIAIVISLGALGWLGFRLNLFLNVMTPLIMVMAFSDSMQITFAIRDRLRAGEGVKAAIASAIRIVGPACVLTHATAILSFTVLIFSDSGLIRTFGIAGALAAVVSFLTVIAAMPVIGLLLIRPSSIGTSTKDPAIDALRAITRVTVGHVLTRPNLYSCLGIATLIACGSAYLSLEPRYRLADQVPDREQAVMAAGRLDAKLTGANPVHVLIELPDGAELYTVPALDVVTAVHKAMEGESGVGNVWSLETLRRWLADKARLTDVPSLVSYVGLMPPNLRDRFIATDTKSVVVTGRIPDVDAKDLLPMIERMDRSLDAVRTANPTYKITVTGLTVVAARNASGLIQELNLGLAIEMIVVSGLIRLAFRTLAVALASMLPDFIPVVAAGALLWLTGEGLQFASIVALTVAFGLGLDATVHFLNRHRLEDHPGADPKEVILRAAVLVGPALILTSIVLACGLAVTMLSELPSLRLFGRLCAVTLIAALVADLVVLPAMVLSMKRLLASRGGPARS